MWTPSIAILLSRDNAYAFRSINILIFAKYPVLLSRVWFPALPEKKVMGLERGPLSLVSTTEELLGRKCSGSGLENREYGRRDPPRWPRGTFYPQKLAITSPTSGGRSVDIVRSRTHTMEFFLSCVMNPSWWSVIVRAMLIFMNAILRSKNNSSCSSSS
jgi:hypothetical protein